MELLKSIWKALDGNKRKIAAFYWGVALPCLYILFPDVFPPVVEKVVLMFGIFWTWIGLGHGLSKNLKNYIGV